MMHNMTFGYSNTFLRNLTYHIKRGEQYTLLHGCHESSSTDKRRYTSERGSVDGNGDGDGDVVVGRQAASTGENPARPRGPHAFAIAFLHAPVWALWTPHLRIKEFLPSQLPIDTSLAHFGSLSS
jgi:hypothetical protein